MKIRTFTLLIAILAITGLQAHDLQTDKTDGTSIAIPVNTFDSISFNESEGDFVCGVSTMTDIDGNVYNTVLIGDHCWMKENLNYPTGDSWCYENNTANCNNYGRLYTWQAALTACPSGWHLPSDAEWTQLTNYVVAQGFPNSNLTNGAGNALKSCRQVNSPLGDACNTTEHPRWDSHGTHHGFDEFGFSALPGSYRDGYWWSSTESSSTLAWGRYVSYDISDVYRYYYSKTHGFSVRCLRD